MLTAAFVKAGFVSRWFPLNFFWNAPLRSLFLTFRNFKNVNNHKGQPWLTPLETVLSEAIPVRLLFVVREAKN